MKKFPQLHILTYTSYPKDLSTRRDDFDNYQVMARIIRRKNYYAIGPLALYECVASLAPPQVDLSSWKQHIQECMNDENIENNLLPRDKIDLSPMNNPNKTNQHITLGFTGYPNVGKSSVLNSIVGHKVVSVSRTPGHTKHFQTIHLTPTVRLCDCPGLVFPSYVERPLQVNSIEISFHSLITFIDSRRYLSNCTITRTVYINWISCTMVTDFENSQIGTIGKGDTEL